MKRLCKPTILKILLTLLTLCFIPALFFAGNAYAASTSSITIRFTDDTGKGFPAVSFSVYQIALLSEGESLTLCEPFSSYPLSLPSDDTASSWADFATDLRGYISRDQLPKTTAGVTDASGTLEFSPETFRLEEGLYLILGEPSLAGSRIITPQPSFFLVRKWESQPLLIAPKYTVTPKDPVPDGSNVTQKQSGKRSAPSTGETLPFPAIAWGILFPLSALTIILLLRTRFKRIGRVFL